MTLRDVVARLDEFEDDETIFAESPTPMAQAVVAVEAVDGSPPSSAVGLRYLHKLQAVAFYAEHDAWLPVD